MSAANDNSGDDNCGGRDLALPVIGMRAIPVAGGAGVDLAAGGFDHAAIVTLRTVSASSGKFQRFTDGGATNLRAAAIGNLRPAPADINAITGALAAMIAEMPVRGGIVDRLS